MSPEQLQAYITSEADTVKVPYLVITGIFLFCCRADFICPPFLRFSRHERKEASTDSRKGLNRILDYPLHLIKGVMAQFLLCRGAGGSGEVSSFAS